MEKIERNIRMLVGFSVLLGCLLAFAGIASAGGIVSASAQWTYHLSPGKNVIAATTDFPLETLQRPIWGVSLVQQIINGQLVTIGPDNYFENRMIESQDRARLGDIFIIDCETDISLWVEGTEYFMTGLYAQTVKVGKKEYNVMAIPTGISITAQQYLKWGVIWNWIKDISTGNIARKGLAFDINLAPGKVYLLEELPEVTITVSPESPEGLYLSGENILLAVFQGKSNKSFILGGGGIDIITTGLEINNLVITLDSMPLDGQIYRWDSNYSWWFPSSPYFEGIPIEAGVPFLIEIHANVVGQGSLKTSFNWVNGKEEIITLGVPCQTNELIF